MLLLIIFFLKEEQGIWDSLKSALGGGHEEQKDDDVIKTAMNSTTSDDVINVFSLASGHLYERLMRIMMLSVLRTTEKSNVKFWILKNYISPQFKKVSFLLILRLRFRCEVEVLIKRSLK